MDFLHFDWVVCDRAMNLQNSLFPCLALIPVGKRTFPVCPFLSDAPNSATVYPPLIFFTVAKFKWLPH